jgi:hypothetical protein
MNKLSSHRTEANYSRRERAHGRGNRAAYAARAFNRASRRAARFVELDDSAQDALEFDADELNAVCGLSPDWMVC